MLAQDVPHVGLSRGLLTAALLGFRRVVFPGHLRDDQVDPLSVETVIRHESSHGPHPLLRAHLPGLFPKPLEFFLGAFPLEV